MPKTYGPTFEAGSDGSSVSDAGTTEAAFDALADAGGCTSAIAILAGAQGALVGAHRVGTGSFKVDVLGGGTVDRPALVALGAGFAAVFRAPNDALYSTVFSGGFSDPVIVGSNMVRDAPALAALGASAHVVYQAKASGAADYKFFRGELKNGAWDSASDPVGNPQSFGPRAPAAASAGNQLVIVQAGDDSLLYDQIWTGSWAMANAHPNASIQKTVPPAIVALEGGSEDLLVVYARAQDYKIMSTARSNGAWSAPALIGGDAFLSGATNEPVSLAPLAGGKAIMVYRGTDSKPYVSLYDKGAWSAPAALLPNNNPTVDSLPAVARGVCGAEALVAYVESGVKVTALSGATFGAPETVPMSANAKFVALATRP